MEFRRVLFRSLLLTDRFQALAPERAAWSRDLLARLDTYTEVRPLDFFDREFPSVWTGKKHDNARESAVGLFNFTEQPETRSFTAGQLGLEPELKIDDAQTGETWIAAGRVELTIPPHSCRLLTVCQA